MILFSIKSKSSSDFVYTVLISNIYNNNISKVSLQATLYTQY